MKELSLNNGIVSLESIEQADYQELVNILGNEEDYEASVVTIAKEKLSSLSDYNEEQANKDINAIKQQRLIEESSKTEPFSGWLILFICLVVLNGILNIFLLGLLLGALVAVFYFYTAWAFIRRRNNAVYLGRIFLISQIVLSVLMLCIALKQNFAMVENNMGSSMIGFASCFAWLAYLSLSEKVETIYPPFKRSFIKWDYYIIGICCGIPCCHLFYVLINTLIA